MDETERPKVVSADEATRRWLLGRLDGQERQLGELRWRVEQIERELARRRPRPRAARTTVTRPPIEAGASEPGR